MFKRLAAVTLLASTIVATGCGNDLNACGQNFETYGLINANEVQQEGVKYRTIMGNVIFGALFFPGVIAPVYFFGFSMYEPVSANCEKVAAAQKAAQ